MVTALLYLAFGAVLSLLLGTPVQGQMETYLYGLDNCTIETNIDEETALEIMRFGPKGRNQTCFCACAFKVFGVFKNGLYSVKGTREAIKKLKGKENIKRKLLEIATICKEEVTDLDVCQRAAELIDCFCKNGFTLPG